MTDFVKSINAVNGQENEVKSSLQNVEIRVNGQDLAIPVLDSLPDNLFSVSFESTSNTYGIVNYAAGQPATNVIIRSGGTRQVPLATSNDSDIGTWQAFTYIGTVPAVTFGGQLEYTQRSVAGANMDEVTVDVQLSTSIAGNEITHFGHTVGSGTYVHDMTISDEPIPVLKSPVTAFEVRNTTKGSVFSPRQTTAQITASVSSAVAADQGLMFYDTDEDVYKYWDGAAIRELGLAKKSRFLGLQEFFLVGGSKPGESIIGASAGAYTFSTGTKEMFANFQVPPDYVSPAPVTILVHWSPADATVGNVVFQVQHANVSTGSAFGAVGTTDTVLQAAPAVVNQYTITTALTLTGPFIIGDMITFRFFRDTTDPLDTYGDTAQVHGLFISYA